MSRGPITMADGDLDIYVSYSGGGANKLYRNEGDATFVDTASSAGVGDAGINGYGVAWADYDGDGDLDLYVVNGVANVLYRNDGGGIFVDTTSSAGVGDDGDGSGAAWADYDGDGDLDMYVVNYDGANVLYRNEGDGTFVDVTSSAGAGDIVGWDLRVEGPTTTATVISISTSPT